MIYCVRVAIAFAVYGMKNESRRFNMHSEHDLPDKFLMR